MTTSSNKSEPRITALRFQSTEGGDVIRISFPLTHGRGNSALVVKPSIFRSLKKLHDALIDQGADLHLDPMKCEELVLLCATLPKIGGIMSQACGWQGPEGALAFVLPDWTIGGTSMPIVMDPSYAARCIAAGVKGSLAAWRSTVATYVEESNAAAIAILAALAGPLLHFADLPETWVLNIYGNSASGKSTVIIAAASVWGPRYRILSWNATPRALEEAAVANTDTGLFLDDAEQAQLNPATRLAHLHEATHRLTGGRGRLYSRTVSGEGQLPDLRSRTIVLSSSPHSIEKSVKNRTDGDRVRLLEIGIPHGDLGGIWAKSGGTSKLSSKAKSERLASAADANYGHAGRAHIEYLHKNQAELRALVSKHTATFLDGSSAHAGSVEGRIAKKVALLYAAGRLARKAGVLPWSKTRMLEVCRWALGEILAAGLGERLDLNRVIASLHEPLNDRRSIVRVRVETLSDVTLVEGAGGYAWVGHDQLYVRLAGFRSILDKIVGSEISDQDFDAILDRLTAEGALRKGHGGRTQDVRLGSRKLKFLTFSIEALATSIAEAGSGPK